MPAMNPIHTIVLSLAVSAAVPAAETVVAQVSQTVAPLIEAARPALEKLHPGFVMTVKGCPTPVSIKAVASGAAQLGAMVRELKPEERTANPDLVATAIARDAVALVVNAKNPVNALTKDQVRDLLTGAITNWKTVGGEDAPVTVISRTDTNAIIEFIEQRFNLEHQTDGEGGKSMSFRAKGSTSYVGTCVVTGTHKDAYAQVLMKPMAFSFVPLAVASEGRTKSLAVKVLALDGVVPDAATINGGTYPLSRTLYLLTKGEPEGTVKSLRSFLVSSEGQALAAAKGFVPLQ
jgi:phosphate transport system substrate-binding protein